MLDCNVVRIQNGKLVVTEHDINRIYDGFETETRNFRLVFRLFIFMRGLQRIRLKLSENEPEISLSRPQPQH